MLRNKIFIVISLILFPWERGPASDEPTRIPLEEKDLEAPQTYWFGIYMKGTKFGHMMIRKSWLDKDGERIYIVDNYHHMEFAIMGEETTEEYADRYEFDGKPPFALRRIAVFESDQDSAKWTEFARKKDGFEAVLKAEGQAQRMFLKELDYNLSDYMTPVYWFRRGPAPGARLSVRSIDQDEAKIMTETYTVNEVKRPIVDGVRKTIYLADYATSKEGKLGIRRFDENGELLLEQLLGGLMECRLEPEKIAKKSSKSVIDLFALEMVPVDRAIGDPTTVGRLSLRVKAAERPNIPDGPLQALVQDATGQWILRMGLGEGKEHRPTEKDIEENLEETLAFPAHHPEVEKLARKAVGDAKTPPEKVKRLVEFVSEYLEDTWSADSLSVFEIMARKKGDCSEHSDLFTTLARALGIPARSVSGFVYMGDDEKAFGLHAWNEVVLDGLWVPVDPTWNEIRISATHIRFAVGYSTESLDENFGKIRFEVERVARWF